MLKIIQNKAENKHFHIYFLLFAKSSCAKDKANSHS